MKHFWTILSHEIRMLLVNPATYIAAVLFLGVMGGIFFWIVGQYSGTAQEYSPAFLFFALFWVPVCFMVPLFTMKCLAEERRLGTLETLLTTSVTTTEVVLGKFFAAYFLYCALWASTGAYFYLLRHFSDDARFLDPASIVGGYTFIAVSGLFFISIGVFTSSFTRSQPVAGISSCALLLVLTIGTNVLHDTEMLSTVTALHPLKDAVDYAHVFQHLEDFCRGVADTRELLFYLSGTVLALIFSILGIEARLLHS
ncbi:MAG TPA: ABC transporter permease subunit [Opitutaceae bacterium]|jgi:ABC-2 type transport system permease protein|nr:ABC transporter permease subunit [Opitutaceae bacterium]